MATNKYLLDTQILIWAMSGEYELLGDSIHSIITSPQFEIYVSVASVWEMTIKSSKGKLTIPSDIEYVLHKAKYIPLTINLDHALETKHLPWIHKDPFDRLLIAQSRVEHLTLISSDPKMKRYELSLLSA